MSIAQPHVHRDRGAPLNEIACDCMTALDGQCAAGAPINRLDPRTRVVVAVTFALVVVALGHVPTLLVAVILAALAALAARLDPRGTLRRMLALDGFMIMALVLLPFTQPGDPVASFWGIEASRQGMEQALVILLKANAVVLMVLGLVGSMDNATLGHALGRLGAPEKLVNLFMFTIRYLDVLHQEYGRLRIAMRARAFVMRCNWHTWASIGYLFGMLMVRSIERSERIVAAMRCRGFDGRFPHHEKPSRFQLPDGLFVLASLACLVILVTVEIA